MVGFQPNNFVIRKQQFAQGLNIQPFIRRPFDTAVIEIEPVHIDDGFHGLPPIKQQRRVKPASHPVSKDRGECDYIIAEFLFCFI